MFGVDQRDARAMSGNGVTEGDPGGQAPLSPDQWRQLESLLDVLLDTPPERRSLLFAEVSGGDPARRAELEQLVAECERSYPLLDRPAADRFAALVHTSPLKPSQVVAERYRIIREIGRGGMATVYLAHDIKHDRDVALKVLRTELAAALGSGRFLREIQIAARLRHPHIVPLYDSGRVPAPGPGTLGGHAADGIVYYVMPYEAGESLRERLRREGRLPITDVVAILRDVCEALAYAHEQGVVHRDIKPDNVLLSGGHALVTDFGVARAASEASDTTSTTTAAGVMLGTPAYMAPEQVAADPKVDYRADIYAVGALAYEMLAGFPPFRGESTQEVLAAQLTDPPVAVATHRPDVPDALAGLVMKCLEKKPANRWQSANAIGQALGEPMPQRAVAASVSAPSRQDHGSSLAGTRLAMMTWRPARRLTTVVVGALATGGVIFAVQRATRDIRRGADGSGSPVVIGILPVKAASHGTNLDWLATGLERQLPIELTPVVGLAVRPTETIAAALATNWSLDSIALVRKVDYFVRASLSEGNSDSALVTLELIEGGIRSVRVGSLRVPLRGTTATVEVIGRRLAEDIRPLLGSRVREREAENRSADLAATELRRRAWQQRLLVRQHLVAQNAGAAERALDSATVLLIEAQRRDPGWREPRLERASLSGTRALLALQRTGGPGLTVVGNFDGGIGIVDSLLRRTPRDPVALAARGRLLMQRAMFSLEDSVEKQTATVAARNDLETAFDLDTTITAAAADLSQILFNEARYEDAAALAERAYRLDSYMEESSQIMNRLALSSLELERDSAAAAWCAAGRRRFPNNPAHWACVLEVMAWGAGRVDPDSAWTAHGEARRLTGQRNVSALAIYDFAIAGALARSPGVSVDSARAVLARARAAFEASNDTRRTVRNDLLAREAAVRYRLADSATADSLMDQLRRADPRQADRLARRRMLRAFVRLDATPAAR